MLGCAKFQSAPLTKARGDIWAFGIRGYCFVGFNPLPSQKQGETLSEVGKMPASVVSIRSPHKSKGRLWLVPPMGTSYWFQSAPLTKARGDILMFYPLLEVLLFQSAPLTKARGD